MPNKESLHRFFCHLLAMKQEISRQWRLCKQGVFRRTQILGSFRNQALVSATSAGSCGID
jgi:hypothetical protein